MTEGPELRRGDVGGAVKNPETGPRPTVSTALAAALAFALLLLPSASARADEIEAEVVSFGDGDSLTILRVLDGRKVESRVRLFGVDSPELDQPFGRKAKRTAAALAVRKSVRVRVVDQDRHGRMVAVVTLPDGLALNEELVRLGAACCFPRFAQLDPALSRRLAATQEEAKRARRGLWQAESPTPPWEWRDAHPRER